MLQGRIVLAFLMLSVSSLPGSLWAAPPRTERSPNIVLIFCDDLGYGDLACYGSKDLSTPHLDQLARQGVRLTNFYVPQAVCSASRAAILTGCYPNRIGILGALGPSSKIGISEKETTMAEMLKAKGYATAIYGKWHLGWQPQFLPTRHGFDDYFGLPYSNDMWPKHPTAKFPDLPLIDKETTIALNPDQTQLTTQYTQQAVKFIAEHRDKPFFLYVPHSMPHVPLHVSEKFRGKSPRGLFGDVIAEIDWSVGEILQALKKHQLEDNTLVIFTSDNGPWLSYGHHAGAAGPLREGKGTEWEGGVRVPCILRWPGKLPAGKELKEPMMTIDFFPTFAHLAGSPLPGHTIDGENIWPLLTGGSRTTPRAYFFYWENHLQAVCYGPWKYHFPHPYRTLAGKPGGQDGKPAPYTQTATTAVLFNLKTDPGETTDVSVQHPEVVAQIQKLAEEMRRELGDSATKQKGVGVRTAGKAD